MSTKTFEELTLESLVSLLAPAVKAKMVSVQRDTDARFEEDLIDANNRIDELLAEVAILTGAIEGNAAAGQRLVAENAAHIERIKKQTAHLASLTAAQTAARQKIGMLTAKAEKEREAKEEAEAKIQRMEREVNIRQNMHNSAIQGLEVEVRQRQEKINELNEQHANDANELELLRDRNASLAARLARAEAIARDLNQRETDKPAVEVKGAKSALCVKGDVALASSDGFLATAADREWENKCK